MLKNHNLEANWVSNEEMQVDPDLFNKNKPLFTTLKNTQEKKN